VRAEGRGQRAEEREEGKGRRKRKKGTGRLEEQKE
jgi:hypothetical protein